MSELSRPEDILLELGGCGRFQVILSCLVHMMKTVVAWSMYTPVFISKSPQWWCVDDLVGLNQTLEEFQADWNISLLEACVTHNGSRCSKFQFDTDIRTIISEWNLVCEDSWVSATIMSIQMSGLLLGHIATGHLADAIGRKSPLFLSVVIMLIFNLVTAFSVSWAMFAACRFLIGLGMGGFLTVQYNLQCEFALPKWRALIVTVPSWTFEACLFALTAWRLRDWRSVHIAIAAIAGACLVTWLFIPESFRWLLAHNKCNKAERVIRKVSKVNRKDPPDMTQLEHIALEESKRTTARAASDRKYSVLDLIKTRHLLLLTLALAVNWFTLGFASYGILFGVKSWTGNIFLNIFLFNISTVPPTLLSIYLMNKIGRKRSAALSYGICATGAAIVTIIQYIDTDLRGPLTNGFALVANVGIQTAWGAVQTMTTEVYPTVIRNIGYGTLNIIARVGGILGPQLVYLDTHVPGIMYIICFAVSFCSFCIVVCVVPETKDSALADVIDVRSDTDNVTDDVTDVTA